MAKTYETYKDSGVAWIGEIPSTWNVKRLDAFYNPRNEKVSDKDYAPLSVTMKGIVPQLETAAKTDDGDNRKLVLRGDFAINSRSDRRGSCGISNYDGSVALINTVLSPKGKMNADYYNWLFHTSLFADEYYKWGHGIVDDLWTTRWSEMKNINVVNPSLLEQQAIASFLDKKCGEIDSLIALQEEMIVELQAYKQSVITEAVTKGLDHNVKMKDSGVEWIGEIPEHWDVMRLKFKSKFINGFAFKSDFLSADGECPVIRIGDIVNEKISYENIVFVSKSKDLDEYKIITNDILIAMSGATVGKIGICQSKDNGYINQRVGIVRSQDYKWIWYNLLSSAFLEYIYLMSNGTAQPNISSVGIGNYYVPFPSLSEQQSIATYLDTKTSQIDSLIAIKQEKIAELKAYKKSIIYEYVTGKKKV